MAYIPFTNKKLESGNLNVYRYTVPGGGMRMSDDGTEGDGKCKYICNMDIENGCLKMRKKQSAISEKPPATGTLYSVTKQPFCKRIIMHIGQSLYAYNPEDNTYLLLNSSMPDQNSLFCPFMSKLYIYCGMHIFSIDENMSFAEEEADAPLLYDNMDAQAAPATKKLDVPINLIAPRITVRYVSGFSPVLNGTGYYISLPLDIDSTRSVKVYADGKELKDSWITPNVGNIKISADSNLSSRSEVIVKYYVKKHSDIGFEYYLGGCRIAECFGGNTLGGTRIFFTGNDSKKGCYYKSELQNPLYVPSDETEIIGDGCENVTAVVKMYSYLIIFTQNAVYRMSYSHTNDGVFFGIKQIGAGLGCDCPDSVQLIDNRAVFANSEKGIFIVDPVGDTDEHNIKPISGNVNEDFLGNVGEEKKKAFSVDYDRKYMLFVSDKAYIWDYDKSTFSDSGNYKKSQERLIWYMYDGLISDMYFDYGTRLLSLDTTEIRFYSFGDEDTMAVSGRMRSGSLDFGYVRNMKFVTDMELVIKSLQNTQIVLSFYADGQKYFEKRVNVGKERSIRPKIRLPKKKLFSFDFEISSNDTVEIGDIFIKHMILKK